MNDRLRKKLTEQQRQIEATKDEIVRAVFKKAKPALDSKPMSGDERETLIYADGILKGIRLLSKELIDQIETEKQKKGVS